MLRFVMMKGYAVPETLVSAKLLTLLTDQKVSRIVVSYFVFVPCMIAFWNEWMECNDRKVPGALEKLHRRRIVIVRSDATPDTNFRFSTFKYGHKSSLPHKTGPVLVR
jgi:hypothetical protein